MAKDDTSFDPLSYAQSKLNETGDTDFDPLEYANTKLNDEVVKTSITNKIAVNGEPDTDYVDNVVKFMQELSYNALDDLDSSNVIDKADAEVEQTEATKGLAKGSIKAVTSTAKFFSELTGHVDSKEWLDDTDAYLDKMFNTTSNIGEVSETIGRLGVGIWATGGLNVATVPARMAQGFAIDLLAFEGKSGNIADVFDEHNVKLGGITEALKTDMSDSELESRVKNAIGGALIGGTLESVVSAFKYGKTLVQSKGIELQGKDDADVINIVLSELKDETKRVNSLKASIIDEEQPVITKAQFNEGEALYNRATEMIKDVPDNFDELASRGESVVGSSVRQSEADNIIRLADKGLLDIDSLKTTPLYNSLDEATKKQLDGTLGSEEFFNVMENIQSTLVKDVDATLNLKQPLNAEKITPSNAETLARATQDIEADADFITHKGLLKKADKDLKAKLGTDGYELVKDLTETAEGVEDLSLKVTQARVVVGNLAEKYQTALKVANKEGSTESYVRAMLALDNLVMVSKTLKNTTSSIAKAMSAMRINTENSQLFNSLKIMDNIDTDYSMSLLREAMAKGNNEAVIKLMENFSDTTKKLKDHVDNYQDGMFKKIGNVLSETVVAGMLSAPSTLAVNVIGNFYVKHQRVLQDSLQFLSGQVLRGSDRMKAREFRYLMQSQLLSNFNDIKLVGKNIKDWAKSGFKDETFDEAVLARYVQDQEFQHKYVSSQYIRGMEVGNTSSLFNTMINTTGKVARSPYRVIGAIDDYYKRGAFRSELVRVGSRLAEARNISDTDYTKFMDKFIRVNTELHILRNNNHKPTTTWLKANKDYIGTGTGLHKYADEARDHANYMTFQTELKGVLGKGVDFLNSDGFLRVLVPFKLTPINMLKMSISTAFTPLKKQLYKDIFSVGGVKRDIAIAKLAYSSSVLLGVGALIQSGNMTGSFKKEERTAMQSAGIPEYSYRVGNRWFEYKQLEPIATIAGVMTDIYRLQHDLMLRANDIDTTDLDTEAYTVISDLGMSIVNNIVNKTYAKSLADTLAVINGDTSLVDYGGNLISSTVPMSSLANFIGRNFGDGYKKESSEFSEKLFSKYRVFLDRDALDAYGRPIKEIEYTPFLTKASNFDKPENIGALEVARLGINVHKMSKTVTYQGIPVKLEPEEYWTMRRNLDTKFQLADKLTEVVSSEGYKSQSDSIKKQILSNLINQVKLGASQSILTEDRVLGELQKGSSKLIKQATETEPQGTYNTMILKGLSNE